MLRKYIPGQPEIIPYVKDLPKDSTSLRARANATPAVAGAGSAGGVVNAAKQNVSKAVDAVDAVAAKLGAI